MSPSSPKAAAPGEAGRLFREGNLADALTAANAMVRKAPTDIGARILLAELLLFTGNIDRIDVVLDACLDLDATATLVVTEFRQLLRGERSLNDAILSDVRMADMDGLSLYRRIAELKPGLARRFIIVTGDTLSGTVQNFLDTTGRPSIEKPFVAAEIIRVTAAVAAGIDERGRAAG